MYHIQETLLKKSILQKLILDEIKSKYPSKGFKQKKKNSVTPLGTHQRRFYFIRLAIFMNILFFSAACTTVVEYPIIPGKSTGYSGRIFRNNWDLGDYKEEIERRCANVGRFVDKASIKITDKTEIVKNIDYYCWDGITPLVEKNYKSNQEAIDKNLSIEIPTNRGSAEDGNIQNSTGEITKSDSYSKLPKKLNLDEAKSKCISLGFKPKTEKFGNCVMELSR